MLNRFSHESDGQCFAYKSNALLKEKYCDCMDYFHKRCGTYGCPFYKPVDCKDWIRIDGKYMTTMLVPEEVGHVDLQRVRREI